MRKEEVNVNLIKEGLEKLRIGDGDSQLYHNALIGILNSENIDADVMRELLSGKSYYEKIEIAQKLTESARHRWFQVAVSDPKYGKVITESVNTCEYVRASSIYEKIEYLTKKVLEADDVELPLQKLREIWQSQNREIWQNRDLQIMLISKIKDFEFLQEIEKKLYEKNDMYLLDEVYKNPLSKGLLLTDEKECKILRNVYWVNESSIRKKVIERTKNSEAILELLKVRNGWYQELSEEEVSMIFNNHVIDKIEMDAFIEVFVERKKESRKYEEESVRILKALLNHKLSGKIEEDILQGILKLISI